MEFFFPLFSVVYSSDESLMTSACEFWCAILFCSKVSRDFKFNGTHPALFIKHFKVNPIIAFLVCCLFRLMNMYLRSNGFLAFWKLIELSKALECCPIFYLMLDHLMELRNLIIWVMAHCDLSIHNLLVVTIAFQYSVRRGPPINVRVWIKFLNAWCQLRNRYPVFSALEAEKIIGTLVCLFLERQLLGLTVALHDCLISAINLFEEKEWKSSCEKVAKSLAYRVPRDPNCLRMIECISGVDARSKQLRSTVASEILRSFDEEMTDTEDILKSLISTNLKVKTCDLFKIYLYLVLIENCLIFGKKARPAVNELWRKFIWKCSSQVSNTDFRPCAQEVNAASSSFCGRPLAFLTSCQMSSIAYVGFERVTVVCVPRYDMGLHET
ncbi:hypothetical protein Cgig2_013398 [Carnegiea gigantea]|uniref:Uncharacterized protein n=1 Tax=Carnegiea gigantea TaxID=171969 RepID=A0A9Q1KEB3_9CARY|nr:hypothetical protein Cgig2_013398 [Carnegiea gigantea]